ncbi:MAG: NAD(P)-dependent alcohol dehydrogenase [Candidatus Nanopelagicales bacterium]|nr:NAD(P)-dependent alcohol dehydrogenase [Candidatus Nanopelagicales bacterium]
MDVKAYAAPAPSAPLELTTIQRRDLGPDDILIEIKYAGICHSDIHQGREEWGQGIFPMVPGHEIAGVVTEVGANVTKFKVGDHAGVGCFVDTCRECVNCKAGDNNYCLGHSVVTYNGVEKDKSTPTYGGYSSHIVMDENYALHIPAGLDLAQAAPLLCAGITTYSPLSQWNVGPGKKVAIVGLGGLGHMGLKIAKAMGAEVTLISHSPHKEEDAKRLGADHFLLSTDKDAWKAARYSFDFILNTVSVNINVDRYMSLLGMRGVMCMVGIPSDPLSVQTGSLVASQKSLTGSSIGSITETQEMLDFCAKHNLGADIEIIDIQDVNEAWDRVVASDVKFRFVIDIASLNK